MTRTQLRDLPRQDLIELAKRHEPGVYLHDKLLFAELAERLEEFPRVDDYPFNALTTPEGQDA